MKMTQNKTIYHLNNDCIQQIIKRLSINEILILEKVDKRFEYCVKEVLKQQRVICFGGFHPIVCKYSAINSMITNREIDIKSNELKTILKKCPNIKCLRLSQILINKSLIEGISNICKQLVCIHLFRPKSNSKTPEIDFKEIGKLLSDKIEIKIKFGFNDMKDDSIIALIQNMPQIKDIGFYYKLFVREIIPHLGHNLKSLTIKGGMDLDLNQLNAIKNNTNLDNLELYLFEDRYNSQQIFDFICNNFIELKSLSFSGKRIELSLNELFKLIILEALDLNVIHMKFDFSDSNANFASNKLKSIKFNDSIIDLKKFEDFVKTIPNIEKFALIETQIIDISYEKYSKRECYRNFVESLLKLNHLKVLEIKSDFYKSLIAKNDLLKAINNQKFKQLKELKINNKQFSEKFFALNIR
jgi:hypothetical protein